jgi:hypothetical protein
MIKIYIRQEDHIGQTSLYIFDELEDGRRLVVKPMDMVFSECDEAKIIEPSLKFSRLRGSNFLSELSNALIESGYRDRIVDTKGEIKRIENHLEDMRKLVFKEK